MINIPKDDKGRMSLAHALARLSPEEREQVLGFTERNDINPSVKSRELSRALEAVIRLREADSLTDFVTGIANRRYFELEANRAHASVVRSEKDRQDSIKSGRVPLPRERYFLAYFDINGMKGLNDRYGHNVGDEALKTFGNALSGVLKRKEEMCARIGGDEFVVILRDDGKPKYVSRAHEYFKKKLKPIPFKCDDVTYDLTAGFGMTEIKPYRTVEETIAIADAKANKSKARMGIVRGHLPYILSNTEPVNEETPATPQILAPHVA